MPATNANLLDSLNQDYGRIHYLAEDYIKKIDNLYERGKYKIYGNTFAFTCNALHEDSCEKIADEIKNIRGYANVEIKIVSDGGYEELECKCDFIASIFIEPKLIK